MGYFYQVVRPDEKPEDAKCRDDCDVMATVCEVRPESGSGKYCVDEPAKWQRAQQCFNDYKRETEEEMTTKFNDLITEFTDGCVILSNAQGTPQGVEVQRRGCRCAYSRFGIFQIFVGVITRNICIAQFYLTYHELLFFCWSKVPVSCTDNIWCS